MRRLRLREGERREKREEEREQRRNRARRKRKNSAPFFFFFFKSPFPSSAALAAIDALPFVPGGHENSKLTIVANDWHSALVPVLIKDVEKPAGRFKNAKVALCIHNAAFQGRFHADSFGEQF